MDVRIIVRFLLKRSFSKMKSNLKNVYFKRPFGVVKISLKKYFYISKYIIMYFRFHSNKRAF